MSDEASSLENSVQDFCQHALIIQTSQDIGKQRRSLKWLEEFSRQPSCWHSVLKILSIKWSPAEKMKIVWGQAATILLRHLRVCDDTQEPHAQRIYQVVWEALFKSTSWEITRLLSALSATCILRLHPSEFQKAYQQMHQLDLGANLQVLAFIAQEFQSMNNMHKNMRMYRDFLHSQLKGPILECIKNGLKTEKHRRVAAQCLEAWASSNQTLVTGQPPLTLQDLCDQSTIMQPLILMATQSGRVARTAIATFCATMGHSQDFELPSKRNGLDGLTTHDTEAQARRVQQSRTTLLRMCMFAIKLANQKILARGTDAEMKTKRRICLLLYEIVDRHRTTLSRINTPLATRVNRQLLDTLLRISAADVSLGKIFLWLWDDLLQREDYFVQVLLPKVGQRQQFVQRLYRCLLAGCRVPSGALCGTEAVDIENAQFREYAADVSGSFARGWPIDLPGAGIVHVALKIFAQALEAKVPSVAQISVLEASLLLLRPVAEELLAEVNCDTDEDDGDEGPRDRPVVLDDLMCDSSALARQAVSQIWRLLVKALPKLCSLGKRTNNSCVLLLCRSACRLLQETVQLLQLPHALSRRHVISYLMTVITQISGHTSSTPASHRHRPQAALMDAVGCLFNAVRFLSKGPPAPGSSLPGSDSPTVSLGVRKGAMMTGRKLLELFGRMWQNNQQQQQRQRSYPALAQVVRAIVHVTGHVYGDDESLSGKVHRMLRLFVDTVRAARSSDASRAGSLDVLRLACREMSPRTAVHLCRTMLWPTCKEVFTAPRFSEAVRKEASRVLSQLLLSMGNHAPSACSQQIMQLQVQVLLRRQDPDSLLVLSAWVRHSCQESSAAAVAGMMRAVWKAIHSTQGLILERAFQLARTVFIFCPHAFLLDKRLLQTVFAQATAVLMNEDMQRTVVRAAMSVVCPNSGLQRINHPIQRQALLQALSQCGPALLRAMCHRLMKKGKRLRCVEDTLCRLIGPPIRRARVEVRVAEMVQGLKESFCRSILACRVVPALPATHKEEVMLLAQFQGVCKNKTQFQELVQKCRQMFGEKKKLSFVM